MAHEMVSSVFQAVLDLNLNLKLHVAAFNEPPSSCLVEIVEEYGEASTYITSIRMQFRDF